MRPELLAAVVRYRHAIPTRTLEGRLGERLGRGLGASLEFADFRDYAPGDDVRRVDWRGFARTDRLQIRLHRDEIAPALDVVLDVSASMGATDAKARATRDLAEAFAFWARRAGDRPRTLAAGGDVVDDAAVDGITFAGPSVGSDLVPRTPLRANGVRVLISDFLFPEDPTPAIRRIAAGAAHLDVVQLLDPAEADPADDGAVTLIDCEDGARLDVRIDAAVRRSYSERFARLTGAVEAAARGVGGRFVRVLAASPETMCRERLLSAGVVEPHR